MSIYENPNKKDISAQALNFLCIYIEVFSEKETDLHPFTWLDMNHPTMNRPSHKGVVMASGMPLL